ncbi:MAG: hypothetical protein J7J68_01845 [Thermotogaceae bacterium]|nr:hypothetical protein [Thermotogaceae bacterium]
MVLGFVTVLYYVMTAYVCVMLIWNFIKTKSVTQEILYALALIPLILRLLRMK